MTKKYQNPPIREAVCEFLFPPEVKWDLTVPGMLYEKLKDRYPQKEQRLLSSTELIQDEARLGQRLKQELRILFRDPAGNRLIQLGDHLLSVNALKPYGGWEDYRPRIAEALNAILGIVNTERFLRVGLRYINLIEVPGQRVELEEYFDFRPFIGAGLAPDHEDFIVGCRFAFPQNRSTCKVVLTTGAPDTDGNLAFLLDLDFGTAIPNDLKVEDALSWIDEAHERVEALFEGCMTDVSRNIFGAAG